MQNSEYTFWLTPHTYHGIFSFSIAPVRKQPIFSFVSRKKDARRGVFSFKVSPRLLRGNDIFRISPFRFWAKQYSYPFKVDPYGTFDATIETAAFAKLVPRKIDAQVKEDIRFEKVDTEHNVGFIKRSEFSKIAPIIDANNVKSSLFKLLNRDFHVNLHYPVKGPAINRLFFTSLHDDNSAKLVNRTFVGVIENGGYGPITNRLFESLLQVDSALPIISRVFGSRLGGMETAPLIPSLLDTIRLPHDQTKKIAAPFDLLIFDKNQASKSLGSVTTVEQLYEAEQDNGIYSILEALPFSKKTSGQDTLLFLPAHAMNVSEMNGLLNNIVHSSIDIQKNVHLLLSYRFNKTFGTDSSFVNSTQAKINGANLTTVEPTRKSDFGSELLTLLAVKADADIGSFQQVCLESEMKGEQALLKTELVFPINVDHRLSAFKDSDVIIIPISLGDQLAVVKELSIVTLNEAIHDSQQNGMVISSKTADSMKKLAAILPTSTSKHKDQIDIVIGGNDKAEPKSKKIFLPNISSAGGNTMFPAVLNKMKKATYSPTFICHTEMMSQIEKIPIKAAVDHDSFYKKLPLGVTINLTSYFKEVSKAALIKLASHFQAVPIEGKIKLASQFIHIPIDSILRNESISSWFSYDAVFVLPNIAKKEQSIHTKCVIEADGKQNWVMPGLLLKSHHAMFDLHDIVMIEEIKRAAILPMYANVLADGHFQPVLKDAALILPTQYDLDGKNTLVLLQSIAENGLYPTRIENVHKGKLPYIPQHIPDNHVWLLLGMQNYWNRFTWMKWR